MEHYFMKIITRGKFFIGRELHWQNITTEYCGVDMQDVTSCLSCWLATVRDAKLEGWGSIDYQLLANKIFTAMKNGKGRSDQYKVVAKLSTEYKIKGSDKLRKIEVSVMLSKSSDSSEKF